MNTVVCHPSNTFPFVLNVGEGGYLWVNQIDFPQIICCVSVFMPSWVHSKSVNDGGDNILAPELFFANKQKPFDAFKLEVSLLHQEDFILTNSYFVIKGTFLRDGGPWPRKRTSPNAQEGERAGVRCCGKTYDVQVLTESPILALYPQFFYTVS